MEKEKLNKDGPIVSIIIATYNAGKNIEECLLSVTAQSNKQIEIIIVDGGSTDDTIEIIKRFDNITWISKPDKGIYDALNKGPRLAKGQWLYFLGSDDRLLPGFSAMLLRLTETDTVYYGDCEPFFEGNDPGYTILHGAFSKYRVCKFCINHQSILYPAKVFLKYSYNLKYKVFADWALNIEVWGNEAFKKIFVPITIARYNLKGFSSLSKDEAFEKDKPQLVKKNMGWWLYMRYLFNKYKKKRRTKSA